MKLLNSTILALFCIYLFSACSKSSDDLASSIPIGAESVTRISLAELIQKSNYNIFENQTVKRGLNMAKAVLKDESAVKLIEEFEKNSGAIGITFNKEAYCFSSGSYYGFILSVNDAKQLKETFLKFKVADEGSIKTEKGIYSFALAPTINLAWDKNKFIVLAQYGEGQDSIQLSASKLIALDSKESILADKNFQKFEKDKKDIAVYFSSKFYAELSSTLEKLNKSNSRYLAKNSSSGDIAKGLNKLGDELKGVSFGTFTSFEVGKIAFNTQYYFETPEAEAKFKKLSAQTTGMITDKYLQYIGQNPILCAVLNLKGSGYYNILSETGILKAVEGDLAENGINLKSLLESVNGNVVFSLNGLTLTPKNKNLSEMDALLTMQDNSAKTKANFSFMAELAPHNTIGHFMDSLISKQRQDAVKKMGDGQYTIKNKDFEAYFGVKSNTFYITTDRALVSSLGTIAKSSYSDKVKGKSGYLFGDFSTLKKYAHDFYSQNNDPRQAQYGPLVNGGLSLIETVDGYVKPDMTNEATIYFSNKKDNSLASLFKYLDTVLTNAGSQMGL